MPHRFARIARIARLPLLLAVALALVAPPPAVAGPLEDLKGTLGKTAIEEKKAPPAAPAGTVNIEVDLPDGEYAGRGVGPCGQYAMGIVLGHLGVKLDMEKVFRESNPGGGSFTAPSNVQRYMRRQGVETTIRNNSSLGAIRAEIDAGRVCMAMVSTSGTAHWIAITGYKLDENGKIKSILMSDSYWGNGNPKTHEMPVEEFERRWHRPLKEYGPLDPVIDYDRLLVTFGGKDSHDPSILDSFGNFNTATGDALFGGANSAVVGWNRRDPVQMVGGGAQALGGLAVKVTLDAPGQLLQGGGNWLDDKGRDLREQGGLVGAGGLVVQGTGKVIEGAGTLVRGAGNVVSSGINAVTGGFKRLFGGF